MQIAMMWKSTSSSGWGFNSSSMYANCMIFYYVHYFNDMFECDQ